jgi:hypothetical protein
MKHRAQPRPANKAHPHASRSKRRHLPLIGALVFASAASSWVLAPTHAGARGTTTAASTAFDRSKPAPLTASEESAPALRGLVRRFNPAVALPEADSPWPVDVGYAWSDGGDLHARTVGAGGRALDDRVVRRAASLAKTAWNDLPANDGAGHAIHYWVDGPGDDAVTASGRTGWRERWRAIAGPDPARSPFPPTEYAHAFWLDRANGRLAIQYWFFYPFNEWINHHEGDWEHVEVILEGHACALEDATVVDRFHAIGYEFYFHGWRYQPQNVLRVRALASDGFAAGASNDDHVLVFTGGRGQLLWWKGSQSGGSYPLPARYAGAGSGFGPFRPADDTRRPARFIRAESFRVVLLPEPQRLDTRAHPELSWLRLPFYAGAPRARVNPPLMDALGGGGAPLQPAQRREWDAVDRHPRWTGRPLLDDTLAYLPRDWKLIGPSADGSQLARR